MSSEEKLKRVLKAISASGKIDPEVLKDLSSDEMDLVKSLYDQDLIEESLRFLKTLDTESDLKVLKNKIRQSEKPVIPIWRNVLKYAAVFAVLLGIAYFFQEEKATYSTPQVSEDSIILKMENDRILVIDQEGNQQIVSSDGETLGVQKGNNVSYNTDSEIDELIFNELNIPNGKTFRVELSDGTVVHLNADTKLRYPVKFLEGRNREVYVQGEAYFDVTKDRSHPFIVNTYDVSVEVLGTQFNVSSYSEDSEITTVLVEGSVSMTNSLTQEDNLVLTPGTMGSWNKATQTTTKSEVNTSLFTGWIKGELIFRNSTFKHIAKTLERRYNVDIEVNSETLSEKMLTANFNAGIESVEDILKAIREIHPFDYTINGKQIKITTKSENE